MGSSFLAMGSTISNTVSGSRIEGKDSTKHPTVDAESRPILLAKYLNGHGSQPTNRRNTRSNIEIGIPRFKSCDLRFDSTNRNLRVEGFSKGIGWTRTKAGEFYSSENVQERLFGSRRLKHLAKNIRRTGDNRTFSGRILYRLANRLSWEEGSV